MKMVVGLGNPGLRYRKTRHNLGFWVLDALARSSGIGWKRKRKVSAWLGQGRWRGKNVILVKPTTFMNASGEAVRKAVDYFGLSPQDVLLVVDDVNLKPNSIRIRPRGGAGGHHGLESVIKELQSQDFPRIRVGIGGGEENDLTHHVLSRWGKAEEDRYRKLVDTVVQAVAEIFESGVERAMNRYNKKD